MTLPALINSTNKQEYVVALKKAYETLSQATYKISAENGGIINALSSIPTSTDEEKFNGLANLFAGKMNVSKICTYGNVVTNGCWPSAPKRLDGTGTMNLNAESAIITNDGASYVFNSLSGTCDLGTAPYQTCGAIMVDINGPNKGPFQFGRDVFLFQMNKNGLVPGGGIYNPASNCSTTGNGCAWKVISEGAMNY